MDTWLVNEKRDMLEHAPLKNNEPILMRSIDDCLLTVKLFKRDVQIKFSYRENLYRTLQKKKYKEGIH